METVILNGARNGDLMVDAVSEVLASALQSSGEVEVFKLREIKIADCLGCFGCWVKTPGQCVIDDAERGIVKKLAHAELKVYVTPVVFGGYSYELKKALDRQIGNVLPFFKKFNGEIHHPARYGKYGSLVAVGVLPKPDAESEAIFKGLVNRNAINMHPKAYSTDNVYMTDTDDEVKTKVRGVLEGVGVKGAVA